MQPSQAVGIEHAATRHAAGMIRALMSLLLWRVAGAKVMLLLTALRWLRGRGAARRGQIGSTR